MVSGNTFTFDQGEDKDLSWLMTDEEDGAGDPVDLTGGAAKLVYTSPAGVITTVDCTIVTTTVYYSFLHAVTELMDGRYPFELWCRNAAGKKLKPKKGTIMVGTSQNPNAVVAL